MTTSLADVCAITMGQAPPGESYNGAGEGMPLVAGAGDFKDGHISPSKFTTSPGKVSKDGDIVLSIRASIGAKVRADGQYCLGRGVAGLRPGPHLDHGFLWHWLSHVERDLVAKGRGATFLQVNRGDIGELQMALPALPEQRRIAAILDQTDALRAKRRQVLAYFDTLRLALFHDMFGDVSDSAPLLELAESFRYGTSAKSGALGYPALRIPNVVGGGLDLTEIKTVDVTDAELERLRLQAGDLLFVRTNGSADNVGRCAIFEPAVVKPLGFGLNEWIFASYLIRARLNHRFDPTYVSTYLATQRGRLQLRERSKTSAGQYNINIEGIGSVRVPDAPLSQQREFVDRLTKLRGSTLLASPVSFDELFASIQSRAFSGGI